MSTTGDSDIMECPTKFETTAMVHAAYESPPEKARLETNNNRNWQRVRKAAQTFDEISTVQESQVEFAAAGRLFHKNQVLAPIKNEADSDSSEEDKSINKDHYFNNLFDSLVQHRSKCNYNLRQGRKQTKNRKWRRIRNAAQTFDEITTIQESQVEFAAVRKPTGRVMEAFRKNQVLARIKTVADSDSSEEGNDKSMNKDDYFNNLFDSLIEPRSKCNYNLRQARKQTKKDDFPKEQLFSFDSDNSLYSTPTKRRRLKKNPSKVKKKRRINKNLVSPDVLRHETIDVDEVWPDLYIEKEGKRRESDSLVLTPDEVSDEPLSVREFPVEMMQPVLQLTPPAIHEISSADSTEFSFLEAQRNLASSTRVKHAQTKLLKNLSVIEEEELSKLSSNAVEEASLLFTPKSSSTARKEDEILKLSTTRKEDEILKLSTAREEDEILKLSTAGKEDEILKLSTTRKEDEILKLSTAREEDEILKLSTAGKEDEILKLPTTRKEDEILKLSTTREEDEILKLSTAGKEDEILKLLTTRKEDEILKLSTTRKEDEILKLSTTRKEDEILKLSSAREEDEILKLSTARKEDEMLKLSTVIKEELFNPGDVEAGSENIEVLQNITIRRAENVSEDTEIADQICGAIIGGLKDLVPVLSTLNTSKEMQQKMNSLNDLVNLL